MKYVRAVGKVSREWTRFANRLRVEPQAGRPILVTGPQRSGTTWFGQMLAASPGTSLYHEPLGRYGVLWNPDATYSLPSGVDVEGLRAKLDAILNGREWKSFHWNHWNSSERVATRFSPTRFFGAPPGRPIIKDPTALGMLDHVVEMCSPRVVVLVRHPCGYASSLRALNWDPTRRIHDIFSHESFERFGVSKYEHIYAHIDDLTFVEKAILQLAIMVTILKWFSDRYDNMLTYQYEALCDRPWETFKSVYSDLNLNYTSSVYDYHNRVTSTPTGNVGRHDVRRDSSRYASIWKKRLSSDEIESAKNMWNKCGMKIYVDEADWIV